MDKLETYAKENDLLLKRTDIESIEEKQLALLGTDDYDLLDAINEHIENKSKDVNEWWLCIGSKNNVWVSLTGLKMDTDSETLGVKIFVIHKKYQDSGVMELMKKLVLTRSEMMKYKIVHPSNSNINYTNTNSNTNSIEKVPREFFIGSNFSMSSVIKHPDTSLLNHPYVRMKFSIEYENKLSSMKVEKDPRLHMYFSNNFSDGIKIIELGNDNTSKQSGLVFEAKSYLNYAPKDLKLNLQVFSDILNPDSDDWCGNQAGSCKIDFSDIINELKARGKYGKTHDLVICVADNFLKGRITLFIDANDIQFPIGFILSDPRKLYNPINVNAETVKSQIMDFIGSKYNTFQKLEPTWKAIHRIHAYVYNPPSAPMLPASIFDVPLSKSASESFYISILKIVLRRYNQTLKWFMEQATDQEVGRVVTEMATVYVNWCKYIPDIIYTSKKGNRYTDSDLNAAKGDIKYIESFDCVRNRGMRGPGVDQFQKDPTDASDCEDFAKGILEFFHEIRNGTWKSAEMKKIEMNNDLWYNFAVLGGVSNAKLDGHFENVKTMNAHEYVIRIPKHLFWKWLQAGCPDSHIHSLVSREEKNKGTHVAVLIAEGTGLLYPDENADPSANLRKQLEHQYPDLMKELRKRYTYERGKESSFYKSCTTAFTSDFAVKSIPYLDFYFCEKQKKGSTHLTYGVKFTDVSSMNTHSICMCAHPPMLKNMRAMVKTVLKDIYHPVSFHPPTQSQIHEFCNNEFVNILLRYAVQERKGSKQQYISDPNAITCFVKSNKANADIANRIANMIERNKMKCVIKPELITNTGVGGYFIILLK